MSISTSVNSYKLRISFAFPCKRTHISTKLRGYLEQSGYTYITFDFVNSDRNMWKYKIYTWVSQVANYLLRMNLKKYVSCLSTIFDIVERLIYPKHPMSCPYEI